MEKSPPIVALDPLTEDNEVVAPHFYVESLAVFPIKSCGAFKIPEGKRWEVKKEGLAWDREWCLIHQGTGAALNQKRYVLSKQSIRIFKLTLVDILACVSYDPRLRLKEEFSVLLVVQSPHQIKSALRFRLAGRTQVSSLHRSVQARRKSLQQSAATEFLSTPTRPP